MALLVFLPAAAWTGIVTPDLLALAAEAGCLSILVGFESLDPQIIARMGKRGVNSTDQYPEQIAAIHRAGIVIMGGFVLGSDGETEASFDTVCRFIEQHNIDVPQLTLSTPFPGTRLWNRLIAEGRVLSRDWELYTTCCGVIQPRDMSWAQMMSGFERAGARLYSKSSILRRIARAASYVGGGGNRLHKLGMIYLSAEIYSRLHQGGLDLTRQRIGDWHRGIAPLMRQGRSLK